MSAPKQKLHWHRQRPDCWWLAYPVRHGQMQGVYLITAAVILQRRRGGGWQALLPSRIAGPVSVIRCHDLRQAGDCARRWAEYRGYQVADRFPTEAGA